MNLRGVMQATKSVPRLGAHTESWASSLHDTAQECLGWTTHFLQLEPADRSTIQLNYLQAIHFLLQIHQDIHPM